MQRKTQVFGIDSFTEMFYGTENATNKLINLSPSRRTAGCVQGGNQCGLLIWLTEKQSRW